jgi:hypothetical protein
VTAVDAREPLTAPEPAARDLRAFLMEVAELHWPDGRTPELAALARTLDQKSLVEALDSPGPERLGAIRLLGLLR